MFKIYSLTFVMSGGNRWRSASEIFKVLSSLTIRVINNFLLLRQGCICLLLLNRRANNQVNEGVDYVHVAGCPVLPKLNKDQSSPKLVRFVGICKYLRELRGVVLIAPGTFYGTQCRNNSSRRQVIWDGRNVRRDFGSGVESGLGDEALEVNGMPSPKSLFHEHDRFVCMASKGLEMRDPILWEVRRRHIER